MNSIPAQFPSSSQTRSSTYSSLVIPDQIWDDEVGARRERDIVIVYSDFCFKKANENGPPNGLKLECD